MSATAKKLATYEDVCLVPEHLVAELVRGTLHTHPRPASPHARSSSKLGAKLDAFDDGSGGPGGWLILDEPELHLSDNIVVPDLGGWRRTRMPVMPEAPFFEQSPDWVCEVLSPSTEAFDRTEKLPIYAQHQVGVVWFINPLLKTLEVLTLDGQTYRLSATHAADAKVRATPFEALELALADLWRR